MLYYLHSPSPKLLALPELLHLVEAITQTGTHTLRCWICNTQGPSAHGLQILCFWSFYCVSVGHFLICVSRVQLVCYESSWASPAPVVLIHQCLIFCFDLCRLPLVPTCLESPSHCERPGPSVRRGGFMGAVALTETQIIA